MPRVALILGLLLPVVVCAQTARPMPKPAEIETAVRRVLDQTHGNGLALAVVDGGRVSYVRAFGIRNAKGEKLEADTVMYGASLTKLVFTYFVMQCVDAGKLQLDTPLGDYLEKPLPDYATYASLADDPRWKKITARMVLTHSTGLANFAFVEPDRKLHLHFEPGSRYAYSGEGLLLLQFVLENGRKDRGLGLDVGALTAQSFGQRGMTRTALQWRPDFAANLADGWDDQGKSQPHDQRSRVRVAGSMDTTIQDMAAFAAALVRGEGLSAASRAEIARPGLAIGMAHQFPTLAPELPAAQRRADLRAGLSVVTFTGPQGAGFYKGGHDSQTANTLVCLERGQRAIVILSNDVRAEAGFAELVRLVLGDTGVPYDWEYGDQAGKSNG